MEMKDTNANAEVFVDKRETPEGSVQDSSLEMEQSDPGRRTSIFKYYSYKNTGEYFKRGMWLQYMY